MKISIHALLAESDAIEFKLNLIDQEFLSTLSLRRATRGEHHANSQKEISIHALLAESDCQLSAPCEAPTISIHALLAESDPRPPAPPWQEFYFYPRSPCGERPHPIGILVRVIEISIHALLAESDAQRFTTLHDIFISIHALLAESDLKTPCVKLSIDVFLSTLSLRRATLFLGRDAAESRYFYPRSPCGERQRLCGCSFPH